MPWWGWALIALGVLVLGIVVFVAVVWWQALSGWGH